MGRRLRLEATVTGTVGEAFLALVATLSFRRWRSGLDSHHGFPPVTGSRYRYRFGSVLRDGRVVEIMRPVGITLKEVLHDPPCRVALTMRWRLEPVAFGCAVRLRAEYRLNHASLLRATHWERRLSRHFRNQFGFLRRNLQARLEASGEVGTEGKNVI